MNLKNNLIKILLNKNSKQLNQKHFLNMDSPACKKNKIEKQ